MDSRMDALAKALASGGSRRELLRMLSRTTLGGALMAIVPVRREPAGPASDDGRTVCNCPCGQVNCGGVCTLVSLDPLNCGACGRACPTGSICVGGACHALGGATTGPVAGGCRAGQTKCGAGCADLLDDRLNCGGCGMACSSNQFCVRGSCQAKTCEPGMVLCSGECVATDSRNCGACGRVCAAGESCVRGTCQCPPGEYRCGSRCANLQIDARSCGACGHVCAAGQTCVGGTCQCPPGQIACGSRCTDVQSDSRNCGACGRVCGSRQRCEEGACR